MGFGINSNPVDLYAYNQPVSQKRVKTDYQREDISFQRFNNEYNQLNNKNGRTKEKVSFWEGVKLVGKGFLNKIKDIGKSIIQHPIKTLAAVGATTLALSALPLIGITAATGGAVLALGFAGYAMFNTGKDIGKAIKHNRNGDYDAMRQDLQNIGGDGVDLALSLPFVPKAINQVKRFAKYGASSFGINKELISNLKNAKNIGDVQLEFAKSKISLDYDMIAKEMDLAVKPKLVFKDLPADPNNLMLGGAFDPTTAELQINKNMIYGKGKLLSKMAKLDTESLIRHELEHCRQFSDVARTEGLGIEGLSKTITEYYEKINDMCLPSQLEKSGFSNEVIENMLKGDKSVFNREFYQQVIDKKGVINAGTTEADLAKQYAQGLLEKIQPKAEDVASFQEACKGLNALNPFDKYKIVKAQLELYKKNILEKEAYNAQDIFHAANIKMRPGIVINNLELLSALTGNKLDTNI